MVKRRIVEITDAHHRLACFLNEGVIETENASIASVEAFSEAYGIELTQIPSGSGDESVQRALMPTTQEIPSDALDVFLAFLTEKQAGEIRVEMSPLRFRKTRSIDFKYLTERILFFSEEHHTSHPSWEGNDDLLSEIYGGLSVKNSVNTYKAAMNVGEPEDMQ